MGQKIVVYTGIVCVVIQSYGAYQVPGKRLAPVDVDHRREELQTGFFTHAAEFAADMPNYTDMVPQVQISVTVKWSSRPGALVSMIS